MYLLRAAAAKKQVTIQHHLNMRHGDIGSKADTRISLVHNSENFRFRWVVAARTSKRRSMSVTAFGQERSQAFMLP